MKMIKKYYHITLSEKKDSILQNGLIPKIGNNSKDANESVPAIYLFTSIQSLIDAMSNWLGEIFEEKYGEDCELTIFEISIPEDIVVNLGIGYEVEVHEKINPEFIKIYNSGLNL